MEFFQHFRDRVVANAYDAKFLDFLFEIQSAPGEEACLKNQLLSYCFFKENVKGSALSLVNADNTEKCIQYLRDALTVANNLTEPIKPNEDTVSFLRIFAKDVKQRMEERTAPDTPSLLHSELLQNINDLIQKVYSVPRWITHIDMIHISNLEKRGDRKAETEKMLSLLHIPSNKYLFEIAEEHPYGAYGATRTHCKRLQQAKTKGWKIVWEWEDDWQLAPNIKPIDFHETMNRLFDQLAAAHFDFDVIMTCAHQPKTKETLFCGALLQQVVSASDASSYIVNTRCLDSLIENLETGGEQLLATLNHCEFALDQYWNRLPHDKWFLTVPPLSIQRPSASNTILQQDYALKRAQQSTPMSTSLSSSPKQQCFLACKLANVAVWSVWTFESKVRFLFADMTIRVYQRGPTGQTLVEVEQERLDLSMTACKRFRHIRILHQVRLGTQAMMEAIATSEDEKWIRLIFALQSGPLGLVIADSSADGSECAWQCILSTVLGKCELSTQNVWWHSETCTKYFGDHPWTTLPSLLSTKGSTKSKDNKQKGELDIASVGPPLFSEAEKSWVFLQHEEPNTWIWSFLNSSTSTTIRQPGFDPSVIPVYSFHLEKDCFVIVKDRKTEQQCVVLVTLPRSLSRQATVSKVEESISITGSPETKEKPMLMAQHPQSSPHLQSVIVKPKRDWIVLCAKQWTTGVEILWEQLKREIGAVDCWLLLSEPIPEFMKQKTLARQCTIQMQSHILYIDAEECKSESPIHIEGISMETRLCIWWKRLKQLYKEQHLLFPKERNIWLLQETVARTGLWPAVFAKISKAYIDYDLLAPQLEMLPIAKASSTPYWNCFSAVLRLSSSFLSQLGKGLDKQSETAEGNIYFPTTCASFGSQYKMASLSNPAVAKDMFGKLWHRNETLISYNEFLKHEDVQTNTQSQMFHGINYLP